MSQTKLRRSKMCIPCSSSTFFIITGVEHIVKTGGATEVCGLVRSGRSYDVTSQGEKKSNSVAILWRDTRAKSTDGDE